MKQIGFNSLLKSKACLVQILLISRLYKTEPINYDCPVSGISLAGSFADEWSRQNQEDSMGLIPCAEGGSSLGEWSVDGVLFRHAITEAKFAMQISELTGILWHQGESDSNNDNYKVYYEKLLISRFVLKK